MPPRRDAGLAAFFGLTFVWSWTFFCLAVPEFRTKGLEDASRWALAALFVGAYGPTLTAVALTAWSGGWPAARRLLAGFLEWRGRWRWHLLALALTFCLGLVALVLYAVVGGHPLRWGAARAVWIPVAVLAAVPFGPLAEEVGWRGFAQPRLLRRWGPLATGAVLGVAWTSWHVPLFFAPLGTSISGQPITVESVTFYLSFLTGLSILIAALSLRSGSHLLTGFLVHLGFNAEVYRFLFELPERRDAIERWALVPMWALVAWLAATGRLAPAPERSPT